MKTLQGRTALVTGASGASAHISPAASPVKG